MARGLGCRFSKPREARKALTAVLLGRSRA